jgi:hypothetical protein
MRLAARNGYGMLTSYVRVGIYCLKVCGLPNAKSTRKHTETQKTQCPRLPALLEMKVPNHDHQDKNDVGHDVYNAHGKSNCYMVEALGTVGLNAYIPRCCKRSAFKKVEKNREDENADVKKEKASSDPCG